MFSDSLNSRYMKIDDTGGGGVDFSVYVNMEEGKESWDGK